MISDLEIILFMYSLSLIALIMVVYKNVNDLVDTKTEIQVLNEEFNKERNKYKNIITTYQMAIRDFSDRLKSNGRHFDMAIDIEQQLNKELDSISED